MMRFDFLRLSIRLSPRSLLVFLFDLAVVATTWLAAFYLRFNLSVPDDYLISAWSALAWVLPIYGIVFLLSGLYRGLWMFASLPDLVRIGKSVLLGATAVAVAAYLLQLHLPPPRSVILLSPLLLIVMMGGARATYRIWKEKRHFGDLLALGKPLLILGAGRAGASLVRELQSSSEWRVVGLLDDDPAKHGREVLGHKVLGSFADLETVAEGSQVRNAIIAIPKSTAGQRQRAATLCLRAGVKGMTVPPLGDLIDGRVTLSAVRQINLEDLLGRDPIWIDASNVRELLHGRTVLVTGAGGSIGSELCRQIARYRPSRIVFVEQNEYALYRLQEEFASAFGDIAFLPLIGDVKDAGRIDQILRLCAPSIIFHAAAYKHVPLMEENNAWQAVLNNVMGTHVVASAAVRHKVQRFVLVSTDKAVNPTNVMGATKRLAEMVCQGLQEQATATAMIVVRFGNVLGSAGSVIPKFQEQVAKGGPVTVTHPDVTRYFMSIPEASQLVLQAAAMADGGQIFVLDMGQPIRIADLARDIIRLSGHSEKQVRIEYTGLRAGEKLSEQLRESSEQLLKTPHPKLQVAQARLISGVHIEAIMREIGRESTLDHDAARGRLSQWVPEYVAMPECVPIVTTVEPSPLEAAVADRAN
jgi:FlaA1/EpsC-like NDP-sugar epimerase